MRISDWSSDVCSSDLRNPANVGRVLLDEGAIEQRLDQRRERGIDSREDRGGDKRDDHHLPVRQRLAEQTAIRGTGILVETCAFCKCGRFVRVRSVITLERKSIVTGTSV